jgi:hypothetical protein
MKVLTDTESPDSMAKIIVRDTGERPVACVLCSDPLSPRAAAHSMARAREARAALGPDLGRVILEPLEEGDIDGLSYAILPFRTPSLQSRLGSLVFRAFFAPSVFRWLERLTEATARELPPALVDRDFAQPLARLAAMGEPTVRTAATGALERLRTGRWSPRHVLMHGDFWGGNLLFDLAPGGPPSPPGSLGFVVIDWETLSLSGYPMFDLIRLALSYTLPPAWLAEHVAAHCRILGCDREDARSYILAALGVFEGTRNHMPLPLFQQMAADCYQGVSAAVDLAAA